jgi:DNA processing protein
MTRRILMKPSEAWLRASCIPGLGPGVLRRLLAELGDIETVVGSRPRTLESLGLPAETALSLANGDNAQLAGAVKWLAAAPDRRFVAPCDPAYPERLRQLPDAPPGLFVRGVADILPDPMLAIVGSRNPSPTGLENAFDFSAFLSRCGFGIVSGLALGIDGKAHEGALAGGSPTVAVCGTGLDQVYPPQHRDLSESIVERGALVSEFPPGTPPRRENFPRRNRLISGLSLGVLVVEAGLRSGSLITARCAAEQGREVFAIPGSIHNPMARGCHRLIKQGAKLVESGQDLLSELRSVVDLQRMSESAETSEDTETAAGLDAEYEEFLESCGHDPFTVDQIVSRTKLTSAEVSSMLLILELQGFVESGPGGRYTRVSKRS